MIAKLKSNKPLTSADIKILEDILWSEVGTKQDYEAEYGEKTSGRICTRNCRIGHDSCKGRLLRSF